jgi:hypothetical protein
MKKNLTSKEVIDLAKILEWEPTFNDVFITLNTEDVDGDLVLADDTMSEIQYIVATSKGVVNVSEGDRVLIDLKSLMIKERNPYNQDEIKTSIEISPIYVNGVTLGRIKDRSIIGISKQPKIDIKL